MSKYREIPIGAAESIATHYDKDQVIIIAWDKEHGKTHVTTFGKTKDDKLQAAAGGNKLKVALGWPDELCHAEPKLT